jgi:hypothetical protein
MRGVVGCVLFESPPPQPERIIRNSARKIILFIYGTHVFKAITFEFRGAPPIGGASLGTTS